MCAGRVPLGAELPAARLTGRSVPAPLRTAGLLAGSLAVARTLLRPPCPASIAASTARGQDRHGQSGCQHTESQPVPAGPGCWQWEIGWQTAVPIDLAPAAALTLRWTALSPTAPGATLGWVAVENTLRHGHVGRSNSGAGCCLVPESVQHRLWFVCRCCCVRQQGHGHHSQGANLQVLCPGQWVIRCQVHAVCQAGSLC